MHYPRAFFVLLPVLAMMIVAAPLASAAEVESDEKIAVTFRIHDRSGNHFATAVTDETFMGRWAGGTWITTAEGSGEKAWGGLLAYHFENGLVANIAQDGAFEGQGTVLFYRGFGYLTYRMEDGDRGRVLLVASSPETHFWDVRLLGPTPPIFFTEPEPSPRR